jgi:hypothetical protein
MMEKAVFQLTVLNTIAKTAKMMSVINAVKMT